MSDITDDPNKALFAAAQDLATALSAYGLDHTFIGGIAVSLLGQPRQTQDIDALVIFDTAEISGLLELLIKRGFSPRFSGMAELAVQARLISMIHDATGSVVDIALGCMPFEEEVMERSFLHQSGSIAIQLPTPEDLVIMKAIAGRPKDLEDIRGIARAHPKLDRNRMRCWLEQYGEVMENERLWSETETLLDTAKAAR